MVTEIRAEGAEAVYQPKRNQNSASINIGGKFQIFYCHFHGLELSPLFSFGETRSVRLVIFEILEETSFQFFLTHTLYLPVFLPVCLNTRWGWNSTATKEMLRRLHTR